MLPTPTPTRTPVIVNGKKIDPRTRLYTPPVPEFEVSLTTLEPNMPYRYSVVHSAALLVVLDGDGTLELNAQSRRQRVGRRLRRGRPDLREGGRGRALHLG